jgi:hypothetical protein
MKGNVVAFAGLGVLVVAVAIGFMIARPALAQVEASFTSSDTAASTTMSDPTTATASTDAATTTNTATDTTTGATTTTTDAPATTVKSNIAPESSPQTTDASTEPPPAGLTLAHIIGTKYVDYFTDGATTTSYPGDADIDSHLGEEDAPIPTHAGLTWVHTTGQYLYDTPSGDLDVGDYALQSDGSYIENPTPFISSTSTPAVSGVTSESSSSTQQQQSDSASTTIGSASSTPGAADATATTTS